MNLNIIWCFKNKHILLQAARILKSVNTELKFTAFVSIS